MIKIFFTLIVLFIFISCNISENTNKLYKFDNTDTLYFLSKNYMDLKKTNLGTIKYRFLYLYNHKLKKVHSSIYGYDKPLFKNIIFDNDSYRHSKGDFKEEGIYSSPYQNKYYCDTINYDEVILFHLYSYPSLFDLTIDNYHRINENKNEPKHSYGSVSKLFPNLKYIKNEIIDYKDSIVDYVEFFAPYRKENKVFFTYNNFKCIVYKKDNLLLKVMYVKTALNANEIYRVSKEYNANNHYYRILDSVPNVVKFQSNLDEYKN